MALSRSLLAGHVLQSPAGRPRKHGQQRHLLRARDSARWRQPVQRSPSPASLPGARSAGQPHSRPPLRPMGPASGRKASAGGASERTGGEGSQSAGAPAHRSMPPHTPRQNAPESRGTGGGWGPGCLIFSRAAWEGESDSPGSETSHPREPQEGCLTQRRDQVIVGSGGKKGGEG